MFTDTGYMRAVPEICTFTMAINTEAYLQVLSELRQYNATLVAVSKTKPAADIQQLYDLGQRDFGENYVQELVEKASQLPTDIRWHFIGHLQTNKVKYIAPFVYLIHGVDGFKLLEEINKQGGKNKKPVNVLLQMHIAVEETKFGLDENELNELLRKYATQPLDNVRIDGLMGMASFSTDMNVIRQEFKKLKNVFESIQAPGAAIVPSNGPLKTVSMGMSSDYKIALEEGSTMIRIGSLLFGTRN